MKEEPSYCSSLASGSVAIVLATYNERENVEHLLPELISLADRILVFSGGAVCGEIASSKDYDTVSKQIMRSIVEGKGMLA